MSKISFALKIIYSYLLTGFLNLGLLGVYLILTKESVPPSDLPLFSNLFLWPISSFSSARKILGEDQGTIWNWFNLSTVFLFLCLATVSIKKKGAQ